MVRLISVFVVNTFVVVVVVVVVVAVAVVFFIILIFNCLFTSKYEYKYLYMAYRMHSQGRFYAEVLSGYSYI